MFYFINPHYYSVSVSRRVSELTTFTLTRFYHKVNLVAPYPHLLMYFKNKVCVIKRVLFRKLIRIVFHFALQIESKPQSGVISP